MNPATYLQNTPGVKVLLYGPLGAGKSVLAASVSMLGPTKYLDLQHGAKAAITKGDGVWCNFANLDIELVNSTTDFTRHVEETIQSGKYKFLVVDSASDLDHLIESEYMEGPRQMSYNDSREREGRMIRIGKFFRDKSLCTILTAYEQVSKDGAQINPMLDGKLAQMFPAQLDVIAYVSAKEDGNGGLYRQTLLGGSRIVGRDKTNRLALVEDISLKPHLLWTKLFASAMNSSNLQPLVPKRTV